MNRDCRVQDNWALLRAQELALVHGQPLAVTYSIPDSPPHDNDRQYRFVLQGLEEVSDELKALNIPLIVLRGDVVDEVAALVRRTQASVLVTDFSPLRPDRQTVAELTTRLVMTFEQVDTHNIVPCWVASDKQEWAARTIRPKIQKHLPHFLTEFPKPVRHPHDWAGERQNSDLIADLHRMPQSLPTPSFVPGAAAAHRQLDAFLRKRLSRYADKRNNPTVEAQSDLSPYLHSGQLAPQRAALAAQRFDRDIHAQEAFLEELIVRRELADNFCNYNARYDSFDGFPDWAKKTLNEHRGDPRPHIVSPNRLEAADTHDPLWNATQKQAILTGKIHGYMRMYWAKKILEWSVAPEQALETALYLNDKYGIDGIDPNGYVGVAWSIGGVHDRPWFERDIFGKIRYMSYDGCARKFDVRAYIQSVDQLSMESVR
jgi:deoxyribodipyrimidine photo-lyase